MSKKKNTLKDLDEFLKQQAATLVTPVKLSEKFESEIVEEKPEEPAPQGEPHRQPLSESSKQEVQATVAELKADALVTPEKVLNDLQELAKREGPEFRNKFYDLIIQSIESQNQILAEDKMLINTALYLKSGERWKEAIREYWRKKRN
jgi:hypothetical protein